MKKRTAQLVVVVVVAVVGLTVVSSLRSHMVSPLAQGVGIIITLISPTPMFPAK
jgi:hypothetical protein